MIQKRYINVCPTSGIDPSLTSSTLSSICMNSLVYYASVPTATKTDTNILDITMRGVNAINAVYLSDKYHFAQ